jgi:hypothetical protein
MSSKSISFAGKKSTGHGPYKPRATNDKGSLGGNENVYVENQPVVFAASADGAIDGSKWKPHTPPPNDPHARMDTQVEIDNQRTSFRADATVFVNKKPISRVGDDVETRGTYKNQDGIAGGSSTVFAGDSTGVDLPTISNLAMTEGDDHDADEPGSGTTYVAAQVAAGKVSGTEVANTGGVVAGAVDNTPSKAPGPLSKSCSDIASITPFPTGNAIDDIVLSPNYTVKKMTRYPSTTFDNALRTPSQGLSVEELVCNLKLLAVNCLEPIRAQYPNMVLTNTWRPMGSNLKSQHPLGMAADMQFRGIAKKDYYTIAQWVKDNISYDQFLLEYKTTGTGLPWLHISFNKDTLRKQVLTLMNDVKYGPGLIQLA